MPAMGSCCNPCQPCEAQMNCGRCTPVTTQTCGRPCQWRWSEFPPLSGLYAWLKNASYDDGDGVVRNIPCCEESDCPEPNFDGTTPGDIAYTDCDPNTSESETTGRIVCLPRRLCATAEASIGDEEVCCRGAITFTMPMTCNGDEPYWDGSGRCGELELAILVTLKSHDANGECYLEVQVVTVNHTTDVTETTTYEIPADGISFTLGHSTVAGEVGYAITVGPTYGIAHPWNNLPCNPCVCARCLPPEFCITLSRSNPMPVDEECEPCNAKGILSLDECTGGGSLVLTCGEHDYTFTVSLPDIADGICGLNLEVTGDGVSSGLLSLAPEALSFASQNGCYLCCRPGFQTPMSRIGNCANQNCSNCFADEPAEADGCGLVVLQEMSLTATFYIEEEGVPQEEQDYVNVTVSPRWCGEKCNSDDAEAACCEHLIPPAVEDCDNVPTLTMTFIAPDCPEIDGYSEVLIRAVTSPGIYGSNRAGGNPYTIGSAHWWVWGAGFFRLLCRLPELPCLSDLEGDFPEYISFEASWSGGPADPPCNISLLEEVGHYSPPSCDPALFEFKINNPFHGTACAQPCDNGGTITVRVSE